MSWRHLSISGISQLLLTRFSPNFKDKILEPCLKDPSHWIISPKIFSVPKIFLGPTFFSNSNFIDPLKFSNPNVLTKNFFSAQNIFRDQKNFTNSNFIYHKKFSNPNFLGIKIYLDPDNFLHLYFLSPKMSSGPIVLDQTFYWSKDISIKFSNPIHFKTELK